VLLGLMEQSGICFVHRRDRRDDATEYVAPDPRTGTTASAPQSPPEPPQTHRHGPGEPAPLHPSAPPPTRPDPREVYVSYNWRREAQSPLVQGLCDALWERERIRVIRERDVMHWGDSIRQFMQQLAAGRCVLVILSADYLRTPFCMTELHDIQAPGFNIDHVVIAPGGVFAIETKHRLKPTTGRGLDNARVSFDGKALRFPDWTDTKTAEQAAAQARWLSERLTRATGLSVTARPIIALPGWYVENTNRGEVWAMNPKNCGFMLKPGRDRGALAKADIQCIAFQVEQLCRLPGPEGDTDFKRMDKR
jgi:hypothetical protein